MAFFSGLARGVQAGLAIGARQQDIQLRRQQLADSQRSAFMQQGNERLASNVTSFKGALEAIGKDLEQNQGIPVLLGAFGRVETGGQETPYLTVVDAGQGREALGKYGILSTNLDPNNPNNWLAEAGLPNMTKAQFLDSKAAQDQVATIQLRKLMNKYKGDTRKVAAEWFAGPNWEAKMQAGVSDNLGTQIPAYVARFDQAVNQELGSMTDRIAQEYRDEINLLGSNFAKNGLNLDVSAANKEIDAGRIAFVSEVEQARRQAQGEAVAATERAEALGEAAATQAVTTAEEIAQQTAGTEAPISLAESQTAQGIRPRAPDQTIIDLTPDAEAVLVEQLGKKFSDQIIERRAGALEAVAGLQENAQARQLINEGILTGRFANARLEIGRVLRSLGFNEDDDDVANTEAYMATRAKAVGRIIKLFGAGTGLSDADREYAQQAAAGKITFTEEAIRRIIDIDNRAMIGAIESFNDDFEKLPDRVKAILPLGGVEVPAVGTVPAGAGLSQEEFDSLSPEEQEEVRELMRKMQQ